MSRISNNAARAFTERQAAKDAATKQYNEATQADVQKEKVFLEFIKALNPDTDIMATVDDVYAPLNPEIHARQSVDFRNAKNDLVLRFKVASLPPTTCRYGNKGVDSLTAMSLINDATTKIKRTRDSDVIPKLTAALPMLAEYLDEQHKEAVLNICKGFKGTLEERITELQAGAEALNKKIDTHQSLLSVLDEVTTQLLAHTPANQTATPEAQQSQAKQK